MDHSEKRQGSFSVPSGPVGYAEDRIGVLSRGRNMGFGGSRVSSPEVCERSAGVTGTQGRGRGE